jgi:DNA helicase II / ATP-dependent DNA helicase PcrA
MILSHPSAPLGTVLHLDHYSPSDFTLPCAVLCRNTAPLVSFAYSLLRRDVPCRVLGREIGAALVGIVRKLRAQNIADFHEKLSRWKERELLRCSQTDTSPERVFDQFECLTTFADDLELDATIPDLIAKIELLFEDPKPGAQVLHVVLCTIHKSKGLEWPTVFLLDFQKLLPSRFATQPWQQRQERNLAYVAITRSMDRLLYISSDRWKETL